MRGRTGRWGKGCVVGMASVPNSIKRAFLGRGDMGDRWCAEKMQQYHHHTYHIEKPEKS